MALGAHDITKGLRDAGVCPGDGLFVHSALGKIGYVIGGPRGLIEGLIEAVGSDGLIGMPGFSEDAYDPVSRLELDVSDAARTALRRQVPGYDPQRSDVLKNGAVPEAFRSWPGVCRSPHPTSSVLLLGRDAQDWAQPHDPRGWATGPETPWARLRFRKQMKILLIGVGWNRCSALHASESMATHKRTVTREIKDGTGPDAQWMTAPDVSDDLDRLFPLVGAAWEDGGHVRRGMLGSAETRLTDYTALVEFGRTWINERNRSDGVPASDH